MDDAPSVRVLEGAGGLEADHQGLRRAQATAIVEDAAEAPAAQVLGDDVGAPVVVAPVVDGDDVGVAQARRGLRFGAEAAQERGVVGQGGMEQLDGHASAKADIVGQVDLRRRSRAHGGDQPISPAEHATDLVGHAGHHHAARVPGAPPHPTHPPW